MRSGEFAVGRMRPRPDAAPRAGGRPPGSSLRSAVAPTLWVLCLVLMLRAGDGPPVGLPSGALMPVLLGGQPAKLPLQLAPARHARGRQSSLALGAQYGASRFGSMLAVAEAALGGQLPDLRERVVQRRLVGPQLELADARRVDQPRATGQRHQLATGRGVAPAVVTDRTFRSTRPNTVTVDSALTEPVSTARVARAPRVLLMFVSMGRSMQRAPAVDQPSQAAKKTVHW